VIFARNLSTKAKDALMSEMEGEALTFSSIFERKEKDE